MWPALTGAASSIETPVPDIVLDHIRHTANADAIAEGEFGIGLCPVQAGLITVFIGGSPRDARSLANLIEAFVGPSYARNRPPESEVLADEPFGQAILELAGDCPLQVLHVPRSREEAYLQSLRRLLDLHGRTPPLAAHIVRPLAAILRDFEGAVARCDVAEAIALRDQAWSTGRLSLTNRSFLDAQVKAAEGDFAGLLDHVEKLRLVDMHLPGPVQHTVIDAVARELLPPVGEGDREVLVKTFRENVAPRFGPAFRDHRVAASPAARWAWLAHYLSVEPIATSALTELVLKADDEEREQLVSVMGDFQEKSPDSEEVRRLAEGGEYAAVFATARAGNDLPVEFRAEALTRSAAALDDPVREAQAQEIVAPLPSGGGPSGAGAGETQFIRSPFANVDDWGSWLRSLYEYPEAEDAIKVLRNGSASWTESLGKSRSGLDGWAEYVEVLAGEIAFRRALPLLVQGVLPEGPDSEQLAVDRKDLLLSLTYAIAEDAESGTAGLEALGDLAGVLLATGLGVDDYSAVIGRCETVFIQVSAPPRLASWVLDLVRTVLNEPAPSDASRDEAVRNLVALLLQDAQRSRPLIAREVWIELAEMLETADGLKDALPAVRGASLAGNEDDDFGALSGKTVLLYTLVEAAGERARLYLESATDVRVLVDSSHVGGSRLKEIAARADLVVVASRAAKHAAFETIRPAAGDRLAYARGKGWSSLVSAVSNAQNKLV